MRGPIAFPSGFDRAVSVIASVIAGNNSKQAWLVLVLAVLTGLLDRFSVLCVADTVYGRDTPWRTDMIWVAVALTATFLVGRWARKTGLELAESISDALLISGAQRVTAADWLLIGSDGPGQALSRTAIAIREDASQTALALPAVAAIPVTTAWLSIHEPVALFIVGAVFLGGTALLRRDAARIRAGQTVLADAEAAFDSVARRILAAGAPLRLASAHQAEFCAQALWPAVDDATRAASLDARSHARAAGLFGWLSFLLVIVLLTFASGGSQDNQWMTALVLIAATLHQARHATAAYFAFERVGAAAAQIDAIAERFPAADMPVPVAPARWTTVSFRDVRVEERDTADIFLPATGPLDLDIHRGEIIALDGPNSHDRWTLLHLLCGLVQPDSGFVMLDGRPIPPAMLRGLCGGLLDRGLVSRVQLPPAGTTRMDALLARFDLPATALTLPEQEDAMFVPGESERVRAAIVAAEIEDRPIRIYDERAARVEPRYREAFVETLREARARGRTCVVATGDAAVLAAADQVLRMRDGRLISPAEPVQ
jgi:putative ATP-binding cassette transporter